MNLSIHSWLGASIKAKNEHTRSLLGLLNFAGCLITLATGALSTGLSSAAGCVFCCFVATGVPFSVVDFLSMDTKGQGWDSASNQGQAKR